jgi:pantoate--beta-alanine ligase
VTQVWFPTLDEIYPEGIENVSRFHPPDSLTQILCGRDRPHHFSGVATVVQRLFKTVQPTDVYFGQKDYQQTRIMDWLIQKHFPSIRLHVEPTVREADGLALSSRNIYLSIEERAVAPQLGHALQQVQREFENGNRSVQQLVETFHASLYSPLFSFIYAEIRDAETLNEMDFFADRPVVFVVALKLGKTRLVDNIILK